MTDEILNGYLTLAEMQQAVGDHTEEHEAEHIRAVLAASRQIDLWTGRYFYQDPEPSARVFRAKDTYTVCCGDFAATDDVQVATDDDKDGVFETVWDTAAWQAEPFVRYNDWPYTDITVTSNDTLFPVDRRRPRVQVTALWGWDTVPGPVQEATLSLAVLYFRVKDMSGVTIGLDTEREKMSADPITLAQNLVQPYWVPGGTLPNPAGDECCGS